MVYRNKFKVSDKSSLSIKVLAIVLAIWDTSIECVSLVLRWSSLVLAKTWVLCFSLLKDAECIILSLSLWNGLL